VKGGETGGVEGGQQGFAVTVAGGKIDSDLAGQSIEFENTAAKYHDYNQVKKGSIGAERGGNEEYFFFRESVAAVRRWGCGRKQ